MAILPTYKDFSDKSRYFSTVFIDSKKDFDKYFEEFKNKKNSIWRGLNESKYSSAKSSNQKIENRFTLYEITSEHPYYQHDYKELAEMFWTKNEDNLRMHNKKPKEQYPNFIFDFIQGCIGNKDLFFQEVR